MTKWLLVGSYKPPSLSDTDFTTDMTKSLDKVLTFYENIALVGDFNFDLLRPEKSRPLVELCDIFDLTNLVKEPTCFTKRFEPSLIDLVLTNRPNSFTKTLVCDTGMSDVHKQVFSIMKTHLKPKPNGTTKYRCYKNLDRDELIHDVMSAPFHVGSIFDDIDDACWMTTKLLSDIVHQHIPVRYRRQKQKRQHL